MTEKKEIIIRAGCFEGGKTDPKSLCQVPDCLSASDCIRKKKDVPRHLGMDNNRTEAMGPEVR